MSTVDAAMHLMGHGFDRFVSQCTSKFRIGFRCCTVVSVVDTAGHRKIDFEFGMQQCVLSMQQQITNSQFVM